MSEKLNRSLGLLHATALNMATMVGIGPFITIPLIVSAMGGPQAMLGWVIGAVIAVCDGQVWAELATSIPGEGGSYVYLREAYKKYVGKLMAFLFIWTFLFSGPFEIASGIVGMTNHIGFLSSALTTEHLRWIAFGIALVTIALQYNKVEFVGRFTVVLWIIMIVTVFVTVAVGLSHFQAANAFAFPANWFSFSWGFVIGLGSASMIAIYDLMGYYNVCYLEEEVRNPGYVFPRAILWSVAAITCLYAVMNLIILGVLPWQEIAASNHIVVDIVQKFHGAPAAAALSIMIVLTAYGSVYSLMTSYSRLPFAAARDGFFFSGIAAVHPTRHFPHVSLLLVGAMTALASLFTLDFIIAVAVSSRIVIQFLGQIVGLTLLRKTQPERPRPFTMWLYPIPSMIAFLGFLFVFIGSGIAAAAWGLAWIGAGVLLFFGWARKNREWPFAVPAEAAAK